MGGGNPFLVFPWQQAFLPALKRRILADTDGKPGRAVVIVPNERPWQYFRELFAQDRRAVILPNMLTVQKVFSIWRRHVCGFAPTATLLDQVYYLLQCIKEVGIADRFLGRTFGQMEMAQFLPWGIRLAQLLEDIFQQRISPPNLAVAEGDAHRYAIAILGSLARIATSWQKLLQAQCLTTAGLDAWLTCEHLDDMPLDLCPSRDRQVYIAGFSVLNGSEKLLFKALWQQGAHMCFHADPALATGGEASPVCAPIQALGADWKAQWQVAEAPVEHREEYTFYAAYDGHSQLQQLEEDRLSEPEGTHAIILLDASLLIPALHHLTDRDINISMGYPLNLAPLCGLLRLLFQLLMNRLPDGRYYWRDLDLLFHNPIIGLLRHSGDCVFRRDVLPVLNDLLRGAESQGKENEAARYVDLRVFLEKARSRLPLWAYVMLKLGQRFLASLDECATPASLAGLLDSFCLYVGRNALGLRGLEEVDAAEGNVTENRQFPLDTEALYRLRGKVLPALGCNALAQESFSLATLRNMLFAILDVERIPFKAYPLEGTQVLGMLETRLLHFNHVYVLDASDDFLPGRKAVDPLLPDNLRRIVGLPQRESRRQVVAYNLARLCAGADTVHFYWPEGQMAGALVDGRKSRSRFVEQLIWSWEKSEGKILEPGVGPLASAQSRAMIHRGTPRVIPCTEKMSQRVRQLLAGHISPKMLNSYLSCPASFAYSYVLSLNSPQDVNEGDDPLAVGRCVHDILRSLHEPLLKRMPDSREERENYIDDNWEQIFQEQTSRMESKLPVFSWLYFEKMAPRFIRAYFMEQPVGTQPKFLEEKVQTELELAGEKYIFQGYMDRIDERGGKLVILDYKTGAPRAGESDFWNEGDFIQTLENCLNAEEFVPGDLLDELRQRCPDVQLATYFLMGTRHFQQEVENAALVWLLKTQDQEDFLLKDGMDRQIVLGRCATTLAFIIRHLRHCSEFRPVPDRCDYCEYREACYTAEPPEEVLEGGEGIR